MTIYAYWHRPPTVFAGQVARWNTPGAGIYTVTSFDVNNITVGSTLLTTVRNGQTVLFGSAPGLSDRGRVRVKQPQGVPAGSNPTITIGWAEQGIHDGEVTISVGTYVTVLEEYRLWAKIPRIEVQPNDAGGNPVAPIIYMDNDTPAGNYPTKPVPVSNVGQSIAGTKDPVTGGFDVSFTIENSIQFDPSYSYNTINNGKFTWEFGGGTVISGSTTSRQAVVRYSPGVYTAHLTVISDLGSSHISHRVIFVRDPSNDVTLPHQIVSHSATPKGQEISIKVFQSMDPNVYRDGSMVMIWDEPDPGDEPNANYRMMFVGWHVEDSNSYQYERTGSYGDSTFKLLDINGKLEQMPGFSQEMNFNGAGMPVSVGLWNQTANNNALFFLCFILYWQSTALSVADLLVYSYLLPTMKFLRLTCDADNLYNQANKLANLMIPDFYLTGLVTGEMRLSPDAGLMIATDRPTFAVSAGQFNSSNYSSITVETRRVPRIYELMSGAIKASNAYIYDTATPPNLIVETLWSICPGDKSRGQGAVSQQSTNHLVADQATLNYIEGNRYARLNSPWGNISIKATWDGGQFYMMDPGLMQLVKITLTLNNEQPPKPFPSTTFYAMIKEASFKYNYERTGTTRDAEFTLEMETSGPPAVTISKPSGINV